MIWLESVIRKPAGRGGETVYSLPVACLLLYTRGLHPSVGTCQIPMTADEVTQLIQAGLPGAQVRVLTDDDTHFEAIVIAAQFDGKRSLQRHQLVYAGLGPRMGREIHALSIQAYTPAEWQTERGSRPPR